jgi:hypothetical protein
VLAFQEYKSPASMKTVPHGWTNIGNVSTLGDAVAAFNPTGRINETIIRVVRERHAPIPATFPPTDR